MRQFYFLARISSWIKIEFSSSIFEFDFFRVRFFSRVSLRLRPGYLSDKTAFIPSKVNLHLAIFVWRNQLEELYVCRICSCRSKSNSKIQLEVQLENSTRNPNSVIRQPPDQLDLNFTFISVVFLEQFLTHFQAWRKTALK